MKLHLAGHTNCEEKGFNTSKPGLIDLLILILRNVAQLETAILQILFLLDKHSQPHTPGNLYQLAGIGKGALWQYGADAMWFPKLV